MVEGLGDILHLFTYHYKLLDTCSDINQRPRESEMWKKKNVRKKYELITIVDDSNRLILFLLIKINYMVMRMNVTHWGRWTSFTARSVFVWISGSSTQICYLMGWKMMNHYYDALVNNVLTYIYKILLTWLWSIWWPTIFWTSHRWHWCWWRLHIGMSWKYRIDTISLLDCNFQWIFKIE